MKTIPRTQPRKTRRIDREKHVAEAIAKYAKVARYLFDATHKRRKPGPGRPPVDVWLDGVRMTCEEAAKQLGVSVRTLYRIRDKGPSTYRPTDKSNVIAGRLRWHERKDAA